MAGKPIDIEITTNVDDVVKGTEKVADSFGEVQDALKDTAKASEKASKDIQDDSKDAAKVIDRDLTKSLDEAAEQAKTTGRTVGKSMKDGADKGSEGMSELADESKSTAKEAAASFSSIEDAADALQEVAANAFVGFGPAGMAAGLVAAAGIGLAISALQDNADKINENKEKMLSLAQTIRDNGGALSDGDYVQQMEDYGYAIQDSKEWFEVFQADAVSGFEKLKKIADDTGLSTQDIFKGGFGGADDAKQTLELVSKKLKETEERAEALYNLDGSIDPVNSEAITSLRDYKTQVENNIRAQETAKEIERQRKESIKGTTEALKEDIEQLERRADVMKDKITTDLDYLDGVDSLTAKLKENGNTVADNTAKGRDNQRAIIDQAGVIEDLANKSLEAGGSVADVTTKFNAQKEALIKQVTPAFGGSKEAARQYIEQILKTPKAVTTDVKVDTRTAEQQVRSFIGTPRHMAVHLAPDGTAVDNYIAGMNGRRVYVDFAPRGGVAIAP